MFTLKITMDKKCDLSDLDPGMMLVSDGLVLTISLIAHPLVFSATVENYNLQNLIRMVRGQKKSPVNCSSADRNSLLVKVRGER